MARQVGAEVMPDRREAAVAWEAVPVKVVADWASRQVGPGQAPCSPPAAVSLTVLHRVGQAVEAAPAEIAAEAAVRPTSAAQPAVAGWEAAHMGFPVWGV